MDEENLAGLFPLFLAADNELRLRFLATWSSVRFLLVYDIQCFLFVCLLFWGNFDQFLCLRAMKKFQQWK